MMDRNRDVRRGSMAAVNGSGGLSRRRQQRSTNLRDSPEEDGAMEMQESSRLRDRGVKKDRDRERDRSSSRSKRRRGERWMHGSNREEGDDSSEESVEDDEEEEEEDASVAVRLPPAANSSAMPSSSSIQQQNHHHARKSGFSASKPVRPPPASWKVAEEMIGVSIPRKARTSSLKRPQEYSVSGGGGSGELIYRQASTSPARPSPSSTTAISPPSSSNAAVRKKKQISGTKHRPPKMAKSPSSIQEIEIEVAEVLYGMTRQAPPPETAKQEGNKVDSKDTNGLNTDAKSRVSSPNSISLTPLTSQPSVAPSSNLPMVATAPKRKRPRLRFDEESPTSPASYVTPLTKIDCQMPQKTEEGSSPTSEKNTSVSPAIENGIGSGNLSSPVDIQQDLSKPETGNDGSAADGREKGKVKEEVATLSSKSKEASCVESNVNPEEAAATNAASAKESPREEKFSIDLMALPVPEKSSSDRDGLSDFVSDHKSMGLEKKEIATGEVEKVEKESKHEGTSDRQNAGNFMSDEFELKKQTSKEKISGLQLDLEKHDKDGLSLSSSGREQLQQVPKQQQKSGRMDPKQENTAPSATLPLPVPIAGWPGGFPPFGYMGQVPSLQAVVPMDGNSGAAKTVLPPHFLQPQMRPKRCATHYYIAQNIFYHQQISLMNPFWPTPAAAAAAAVGVAPLFGAKHYNLNAVPPSESAAILGSPLQGGFPPRSMGPLQDKSAPAVAVAMAYTGPPPKEKSSATAAANSNNYMEAAQRKQFLLQQTPQPGLSVASSNMMHGPAFIFQPAMANRPGGPAKYTLGTAGNAAPSAASASSAAAAGSGAAGHPATTMSFNYAGMSPTDAQYMAILQNNAYPFPIAAAQIGAPPAYRGASSAQAMPFFNGPFYSSQMVPSQQQQIMQQQQQHQLQQQQLRQQQQQQQQQPLPPAHSQQGHQNPSTSSGSSSSQKHTQQSKRVPGSGAPAGSNSHGFPPSKQQLHLLPRQARQLERETGCEDSPATADSSRASQAQKGLYGQNIAMPMHSQNFALISPATAAFTAGGSHSESKQSGAHQHQAVKMELTPSQAQAAQAYAMSFASFTGSAAAQGFDFSAIVQNPALMQNLTEGAKHGYQFPAAAVAAAAAVAQAAQHKKGHHEDGKSRGDSAATNANAATEEVKITAAGGGKNTGSVCGQHSLSFSRPDNDPTIPNLWSDANHRMLNGGRSMIPLSSAAPTSSSAAAATATATSSPSSQPSQQQQQMIQLQKQHHRFVQLQQQQQQQQQQQHQHLQLQQQMPPSRPSKSSAAHTGSSNVTSDRLPAGSPNMAARFSQGGLSGFPPSLIQGSSGGSAQSPQWKTSGRAATPAPTSSATSSSSSAKNQMPQQQQPSRSQQQPLLNPGAHQTQISFGVASSNKPSSNPSLSSTTAAAIAAGSPQNSVSKSSAAAGAVASSGSPRASSSSKSGQPPASVLPTLPLQQQQSAAAAAVKNSPSVASGLKSSPITNNNRNMSSILGHHPHIPPSNSTSNKLHQQQQSQQQQQQLQKQSFQQPQLFFNNAYIQAQTSQSNAAPAGYFQHQRRQSEQQQQQQQQQNSTTSGMLTLCPSPLTLSGANVTSDPAKAAAAAAAAAASSIKGLSAPTQAGILQHTAQYAAATSMTPHPFMSAAFPYINAMPSSVSVKPASAVTAAADQKQSTTGNDNMHACWKPEKR